VLEGSLPSLTKAVSKDCCKQEQEAMLCKGSDIIQTSACIHIIKVSLNFEVYWMAVQLHIGRSLIIIMSRRTFITTKVFSCQPYHSSGSYIPLPQHCGSRLIPGQVMWDLWWTKWHWGRFTQSTSVSPAYPHSTKCSIFTYYPGMVQQIN
jgi:hypothetical protein